MEKEWPEWPHTNSVPRSFFISRCITHPSILYQVCDGRGGRAAVLRLREISSPGVVIISNWKRLHVRSDQYVEVMKQLGESGRSSLHASYRSLLARTPTAYTCSGQSERHISPTPIRTLERSSRLSGQEWILFTQPRVTTKQERQRVKSIKRLYFS